MRTSTLVGRSSPSRSNSPSWIARRSFDCAGRGMAPTSSRNSVPPSASWKRPSRSAEAPVNEPRRWPKNSLSQISSGMAAQLTRTYGAGRSRAPLVDDPRQQLLARAGLAAQQHGRARRGRRLHRPQRLLPEQALAEGLLAVRRRAAQVPHLALQGARLQRAHERHLERRRVGRFQDEVAGSGVQALDGGGHAAVAGQHQHRHLRRRRLQAADEVESRQLGHAQVGEHHVDRRALQLAQRVLYARGAFGAEPARA